MSTALALEQTLQSLRDPKNPTFCCRYYLCLLSQIINISVTWENPCLMASPHDKLELIISDLCHSKKLLDTLAAFLTTKRSREEMRALARRMEHCECDRSDATVDLLHSWSWNHGAFSRDPGPFVCRSDTLGCLVSVIADVIYMSLELNDIRHTPWPTTRRHCLVDNDETAATMMCRWLDEYNYLAILRLIASTANSFGLAAQIPFLHSAHLPKNLVQILKLGMDSLPSQINTFDPFGEVYPISIVFITMQAISSTVDDGVSSAYFYREHCGVLLENLNRVAELDARMVWMSNMRWEFGFQLGGIIHAKLVLPIDETLYHRKILEYSKDMRTGILQVQTPYQLAKNIMLTLAEMEPQCMNSQCADGNPASICSGCRRVAYCSRECQNVDWTATAPHKKVCRKLKALGDAAGFPEYATPRAAPPELEIEDFERLVFHAVPWPDIVMFNKHMIEDDRIRRVVNDKYSARYERLLE
ncbi:hypothetical protein C8J56DRAFT_828492 [Mycena floridula]|nr:hypothetical protein C8J56DRAFT_828492 [Mycena floridula]